MAKPLESCGQQGGPIITQGGTATILIHVRNLVAMLQTYERQQRRTWLRRSSRELPIFGARWYCRIDIVPGGTPSFQSFCRPRNLVVDIYDLPGVGIRQ